MFLNEVEFQLNCMEINHSMEYEIQLDVIV